MTLYKFGDIVLVGFPHTDLQGISKRPAIVIYDSGDQDVLVARITTQEVTGSQFMGSDTAIGSQFMGSDTAIDFWGPKLDF